VKIQLFPKWNILPTNERAVFQDLGKVNHKVAEDLAIGEFEKYRVQQDREIKSDFDLFIDKYE